MKNENTSPPTGRQCPRHVTIAESSFKDGDFTLPAFSIRAELDGPCVWLGGTLVHNPRTGRWHLMVSQWWPDARPRSYRDPDRAAFLDMARDGFDAADLAAALGEALLRSQPQARAVLRAAEELATDGLPR